MTKRLQQGEVTLSTLTEMEKEYNERIAQPVVMKIDIPSVAEDQKENDDENKQGSGSEVVIEVNEKHDNFNSSLKEGTSEVIGKEAKRKKLKEKKKKGMKEEGKDVSENGDNKSLPTVSLSPSSITRSFLECVQLLPEELREMLNGNLNTRRGGRERVARERDRKVGKGRGRVDPARAKESNAYHVSKASEVRGGPVQGNREASYAGRSSTLIGGSNNSGDDRDQDNDDDDDDDEYRSIQSIDDDEIRGSLKLLNLCYFFKMKLHAYSPI